MAGLNPWLVAATLVMAGIVPCAAIIARKGLADGVAALQLAGTLATLATLLLAVGLSRPTIADIPMSLAVLSFGSSLLYAHFLERWL